MAMKTIVEETGSGQSIIQYNFIAKWQTQRECVMVLSTLAHTLTPVIKREILLH